MPRSFLVKNTRLERRKCSYRKLQEIYSKKEDLSVAAIAPFTPVHYFNYLHNDVEEQSAKAHHDRYPEFATEPYIKSQSPDLSMTPGGLESPEIFDGCYKYAPYIHNTKLKDAQNKDFINFSVLEGFENYEFHPYALGHGDSNQENYFVDHNSRYKAATEYKLNETKLQDRKETIDYTIDAFISSDGRSKTKQPSQLSLKNSKYICNECGKCYATSSNLSRHKQTHRSLDGKLAKKCPHCDKVYVSMPALSMHVLTHELRHVCPVCSKAFSRPWLLQGHLRSHTGEKPYGCAHCGKAFADRSNLRAHMQTHTSHKTFPCPYCSKSFALKSYLSKHIDSICLKKSDYFYN